MYYYMNIYNNIEETIRKFEEEEKKKLSGINKKKIIYGKGKKEKKNIECNHDIRNIEGVNTCIKCGEMHSFEFVDEYCIYEKSTYKPNLYSRRYNFYNILLRLSYFNTIEKKSKLSLKEILNELPTSYKELKKKLMAMKLNPSNSFYYWKLKNNIDTRINFSDILEYSSDFAKKRISPRKYLYDKFKNHEKYSVFAQIFKLKNS